MPLRIGETFAGYRILRLLGSGGMGEVYLVQHPRLPRRDALKILRADVSGDSSFRERFLREADLAAGLRHPNIVAIHDRGEYNGQLWIAMDYIEGTDAAQLVQQRYPAGMPIDVAIAVITAVASALDYAHQKGLLHRDIKPANIIVTDSDTDERRVFLADFGIARPLDDISGITATNVTVGTVAYAAPEQLMGEEMDGRADQYALAATAYHLLIGVQLFPHSNPAVVISRHLNTTPPTLSDRRPDCVDLDGVLRTALAKNPQDRFPSCSGFAQAVIEACPAQGGASAAATAQAAPQARRSPPASTATPPAEPPATASRRNWAIAASVAAIILLLGAVALVWRPWHSQDSNFSGTTSTTSATIRFTSTNAPPPPPVLPATEIDTLLLSMGAVNDTLGTKTLEVKDSTFGTSDNSAHVTPAACVGVVYGAEQLVYRDTDFLQMRNQQVYPRPYTESEAIDSGRPWRGQQTVVVFPTELMARSVLKSSEDRWRSCASEPVRDQGYEDTAPWELRNVQLLGDVLTASLVDPTPMGPNAGACQHAMGVRLNVLAEAVTCTANTSAAGNGAERIVFAILDKVHA